MTGITRLLGPLVLLLLAMTHDARAADRFRDWQTGDLIFQESLSPQATAIRVATGSRYSHMGIVLRSAGGIRVIEAARTVSETPLKAFIARGARQDYAVYRVRRLTSGQAAAAVEAARTYLGRPYDIFFRLDPSAIYCSELPFYAFRAVGLTIGQAERLGDLKIETPEGRGIFLARWRDHPDCRAGVSAQDECWSLIKTQEIVTPVSIARDAAVKRVVSTFDDAP
ncbi:YiiX/YebB-like N1pC/P60 family cysteine hydrolase [Enterovirga rhinocerotis]|uniref:Permuted papain-like amidase YaeF/Yiix C92 family enzyme n=1 Tax=Enterovirga rhinocerotis TaxID=1339210 RepID=A0A4R7BQV3_9HYPH|nr:YiiX/YebB-like N1pC/P60 family cysteine hydrolase [Enterovirga rhinocerotis]TDR87142.1 permuted papain-like amidase YaeF/Yiix C92 family enzyme [Enterovirga rhinocerotis]